MKDEKIGVILKTWEVFKDEKLSIRSKGPFSGWNYEYFSTTSNINCDTVRVIVNGENSNFLYYKPRYEN